MRIQEIILNRTIEFVKENCNSQLQIVILADSSLFTEKLIDVA